MYGRSSVHRARSRSAPIRPKRRRSSGKKPLAGARSSRRTIYESSRRGGRAAAGGSPRRMLRRAACAGAREKRATLTADPIPMEQLDLRLYAIVDPQNTGGHDLVDLARAVAAGGATLVQLRDKVSDTSRMIDEARKLKAVLASFGVPLIVNDRVDVALAAQADGVHV